MWIKCYQAEANGVVIPTDPTDAICTLAGNINQKGKVCKKGDKVCCCQRKCPADLDKVDCKLVPGVGRIFYKK